MLLDIEDRLLFFEGSEKKAEIQVNTAKISLLNDISNDFWHAMVNCCHAQVLSQVENDHCKAFLLSESSLFVWNDRLVILTCGNTQLVKSVEYFIQQHGVSTIKHLIYQRKNEYFSHAQPSCFGDDIRLLNQYLKGQAYRFGEMDGHHNYVYHQANDFVACPYDKTYELLAYQISPKASKLLTASNLAAAEIKDFLQIEQLLPDFIIDDYVFEPFGYSLNAIKDDKYLTIHVTPQQGSSYISFEANINLVELAPKILSILTPASFDLLSFNEDNFNQQIKQHIPEQYVSKDLVQKQLDNGYFVCFANFVIPQQHFVEPTELDILGDNYAL